MHLRMTQLVFITLLFSIPVFGQTVSTLVNDSNKTFEAIHWHPDGRIYAADYSNGRLYQLSLDGTVTTLVTGIPNVAGGGFGTDGTFYFSGLTGGRVYRLNDDATTTLIASGLDQPTGIVATDSPDTLLVAQYGNSIVAKVSISGGTKTDWVGESGISGPDGIIELENGNLLIANFNNHKIHSINAAGDISLFASVPSSGWMGYIAKAGDNIFVPSLGGRKVYRVAMDGTVNDFAGSGTAGNLDGEGASATFTQPNGIASNATGDTLLITDGVRVRLITNFQEVVGAKEIPLIKALSLSPNPASNILQVSFESMEFLNLKWQVLNQQGQVVLTDNISLYETGKNKLQIPIKDLAAGIYSFQLLDDKGNMEVVQFVRAEE